MELFFKSYKGIIMQVHSTSLPPEFGVDQDVDSKELKKPESLNGKTLTELFGSESLMIPAEKVDRIVKQFELGSAKTLLKHLVELARPFARPPISNYHIGEAALGESGNVYLGVNVEFYGHPLNYAIHGEQFAFANARVHRERAITAIALPAEPCGHCRQFMHEAGTEIAIIILNEPTEIPLSKLLPKPFGPENLDVKGRLLTQPPEFRSSDKNSLIAKAIEAAHDSYAPYSKSPSGVAIMTNQGKIYTGSNLDNAAFNPSLAPLQCALVDFIADQQKYEDIQQVVLVECVDRKISHKACSQALLSTIAPQAMFQHLIVDSNFCPTQAEV